MVSPGMVSASVRRQGKFKHSQSGQLWRLHRLHFQHRKAHLDALSIGLAIRSRRAVERCDGAQARARQRPTPRSDFLAIQTLFRREASIQKAVAPSGGIGRRQECAARYFATMSSHGACNDHGATELSAAMHKG